MDILETIVNVFRPIVGVQPVELVPQEGEDWIAEHAGLSHLTNLKAFTSDFNQLS